MESGRKEISESAFEFLLAEILDLPVTPSSPQEDNNTALCQRLDSMGYDIGYRYVEKILSTQKLLGSEPLDVVKFICKEFWEEVFKKKVSDVHKILFCLLLILM